MDELEILAKSLEDLNYVVQRNWRNLPESMVVDNHDDLDLFCSERDRDKIEEIIKDQPLIDVRSARDDYYPKDIGNALLQDTQEYGGFKIPNEVSYLLALQYHNYVHKENDPYGGEIRRTFLKLFPPVKCKDEGVGFYA